MLMFIETTTDIIHNVLEIQRNGDGISKPITFDVYLGNGFGEREKSIEILASDILCVMTYEYNKK